MIGHSRAMDLILTGRPVPAKEAATMGLANRVVPAGEALDAAIDAPRKSRATPSAACEATGAPPSSSGA